MLKNACGMSLNKRFLNKLWMISPAVLISFGMIELIYIPLQNFLPILILFRFHVFANNLVLLITSFFTFLWLGSIYYIRKISVYITFYIYYYDFCLFFFSKFSDIIHNQFTVVNRLRESVFRSIWGLEKVLHQRQASYSMFNGLRKTEILENLVRVRWPCLRKVCSLLLAAKKEELASEWAGVTRYTGGSTSAIPSFLVWNILHGFVDSWICSHTNCNRAMNCYQQMPYTGKHYLWIACNELYPVIVVNGTHTTAVNDLVAFSMLFA